MMTFDSPVFPHMCAIKILCGARAILASNPIKRARMDDGIQSDQTMIGEVFSDCKLFWFGSFAGEGSLHPRGVQSHRHFEL